jgi:uncharacterized protein YkwD
MDFGKARSSKSVRILKDCAGLCLLAACLFITTQSADAQTQTGLLRYETTASALPDANALREAAAVSYTTETSMGLPAEALASFADARPIERRAFELTNSVRVENGRSPLSWDSDLCRMARDYSEKMARLGFFSHVAPDGSDLRDRARVAGIRFRAIGENIGYNRGIDDPGASTVERWMDSSAHRSNLLGRGYRASAVGVFVSPDGRVYITQLFLTR